MILGLFQFLLSGTRGAEYTEATTTQPELTESEGLEWGSDRHLTRR